MPRTINAISAAAAAALAAVLVLPAAARADAVPAAGPLAAQPSSTVAGYAQLGCHAKGYPVYREIQGTIIVPADVAHQFSGYSSDFLNIGGFPHGVSAGVTVAIEEGYKLYVPFGQWGSNGYTDASFYAKPGDKLAVTIESKGHSGWLVQLVDKTSGKKWSQVQLDPDGDYQCQATAYQLDYSGLTQTTRVAFDSTRVWWSEHGRTGVSKLLGTPPAGASLHRYNLVDSHAFTVAATSNPADSDNNFTVTDAIPTVYTPNLAGYELTQWQGYQYTHVQATWRIPEITKTDPGSYAFAYYFVGIGEANGNGVMAGVVEMMVYGSVSYYPFVQLGAQLDVFKQMPFSPGDTIKAFISSTAQGWNPQVINQTTGQGAGAAAPVKISPYDAEVAELRSANPLGPGYLPLAATTPVTFDHATFTTTPGNKTYPFEAVPPSASLQRLQMQTTSPAKIIAATSQPDSDKDGFTVQDGAAAPAPPKS